MVGALLLPVLYSQAVGSKPAFEGVVSGVSVTGTAYVSFPAEQATIIVQSEATDAKAPEAKSAAENQRAQAVRNAHTIVPEAKAYRSFDTEVGTATGSVPFGGAPDSTPKPFVARANVQIEGVALTKTADLLRTLGNVPGVKAFITLYDVRDRAKARRMGLRAAFLDAKMKAQEAAEAAGMRLGDVVLLEAGNGATVIPTYVNDPADRTPSATPGLTRSVAVSANVQVRFRLVK